MFTFLKKLLFQFSVFILTDLLRVSLLKAVTQTIWVKIGIHLFLFSSYAIKILLSSSANQPLISR